ncbi:MAG: DUF3617 domain-containing protein [Gammaproteobacteria bacterium]|nr:DUF3617 domain-containing protein [Gammaproteobacteria bacterium]MBU1414339.1 DUF3617 domain-containing protein [Gammaproteobacteria bacterium]
MRKNVRFACAICLVVGAAPAWSAGSDELWEMSTTMNMPGMAMPAMKSRTCVAKNGNYRPDKDQDAKNCKMLDYKVSGNTVKWKMQCTGKDAMSGTGEMTKTADTMKGVFKMSSEGMEMTQVMSGRRVGTCDAGEERAKTDKMVADIKAQGDDATRKMCEGSVKRDADNGGLGGDPGIYQAKGLCPTYKPQLCEQARARVNTYAGYGAYLKARNDAQTAGTVKWGWVVSDCGINLDKQRSSLCTRAVTDKKYGFIGAYCPVEAKQLSARHCAGFGRDYTADMASPNAAMCSALRAKSDDYSEQDDAGAAQKPKAAAKEDATAADKAKDAGKKLKSMFGF